MVWQSSPRGFSQISLDVKEEIFKKIRIPPIFWQDVGTYCLNIAIFFSHTMRTLACFLQKQKKKNPLYHLVCLHLMCHQDVKICQKKTLICMLFKGDFRQGSKVQGEPRIRLGTFLARYSPTQGFNLLQIRPNWFLGNWTLDPRLKGA